MNKHVVIAAACAGALTINVQAVFAATVANPIIVTATRTPELLDQTLAPSIVIDRGTIEASQATDVAELLRFHAGIDIGRNGGPGQPASIFIRGADSNHTLVLVDGVKINPATIGGAAIQNLDPALIDHIEIVKGPRSSLYGSEAIGGVVQIFTRRGAAGTTADAKAGLGSHQTQTVGAGFTSATDSLRLGLNASRFHTAGFPARVGGTEDSGHDQTSVNGYVGFSVGELDAELSHWESRGNTEYYDFFLAPLDEDFADSVTALTLSGAVTSQWAATIKLSRMRDEIDQNQSADFAHTRRDVLDWQNDIQLGSHHLLTAGLVLSREQARALSFGTSIDEQTDVKTAFLQDQVTAGRHRVVAAARFLDHQSFGNHATGELSYGYEVSKGLVATASVSTGFRAPDATDRFGYGGNPDLNPETSRNAEIGLRYMPTPTQRVSFALFQNDLDDLILFVDPDGYLGPIPGRNENIDRARIQGAELGYRLDHGPWLINAEIALQNPKNLSNGRQLARRARASLTLNTTYRGPGYRFGVDTIATGPRPDSDFSATENAGYTLFNAYAQFDLAPDWRLRTRLENLLNRHYTLADGFNTQGRSVLFELEYRYAGKEGGGT
jgi:vitamin B12 transporter